MLVAYLISVTGTNMIPAYYLTIGAVVALITLRFVHTYAHDMGRNEHSMAA
jgi:MHS family proline/betaine transporter-like MFS transporter